MKPTTKSRQTKVHLSWRMAQTQSAILHKRMISLHRTRYERRWPLNVKEIDWSEYFLLVFFPSFLSTTTQRAENVVKQIMGSSFVDRSVGRPGEQLLRLSNATNVNDNYGSPRFDPSTETVVVVGWTVDIRMCPAEFISGRIVKACK